MDICQISGDRYILERKLIGSMNQAAREIIDTYTRTDGTLNRLIIKYEDTLLKLLLLGLKILGMTVLRFANIDIIIIFEKESLNLAKRMVREGNRNR